MQFWVLKVYLQINFPKNSPRHCPTLTWILTVQPQEARKLDPLSLSSQSPWALPPEGGERGVAFGGLGGATDPSLEISGFAPPVSCPSFTPGNASSFHTASSGAPSQSHT